mgnify:CR=1 FL=1|jgi:glycerol-3-phosphate acyltransferase PlsY
MSVIHLLLPLFGYLVGSVSSAILVSRVLGLPDPRSSGSRNPGATNVLRLGGKKAAAITLVGDVLKGTVPVLVAGISGASPLIVAATGLGAFLGHVFPVFFGFRGGKGVATAAGVLLAISWPGCLILVVTWLLMAALFRYSSLAALIASALSPGVLWWLGLDRWFVLLAVVMAALLIWRHRANISRLLRGEESRIRLKK